MSPKIATKPKTPQRWNRRSAPAENPLHADDTGHLWAISYADFLMVLLSFFVIFFSVDKNKRSHLIFKISSQLKSNGQGSGDFTSTGEASKGGSGTVPGTVTGVPGPGGPGNKDVGYQKPPPDMRKLKALMTALFPANLRNLKNEDNEKIVIDFPDDFYKSGVVDLGGTSKQEVVKLLQSLQPYADSISIGFVGHSDRVPVRADAPGVKNNVDISVIRASRALEFAAENGFSSAHLYATGSGTQMRQTRSLSVVIKPLDGGLL